MYPITHIHFTTTFFSYPERSLSKEARLLYYYY